MFEIKTCNEYIKKFGYNKLFHIWHKKDCEQFLYITISRLYIHISSYFYINHKIPKEIWDNEIAGIYYLGKKTLQNLLLNKIYNLCLKYPEIKFCK